MENARKKERIDFVDIFRGLGILLMVMGHIKFGDRFDHFIHGFHMPMFFFVSGYFYKKKNISFGEFAVKKSRTLLVPYFVFGILQYGIWLYWNWEKSSEDKLQPLCNLLFKNTKDLPIAGALWFLTALFLADIIYFLLDRIVKNRILLSAIIAAIALWGTVAAKVMPFRLPWAMDAAFVGLGMYHIAQLMRCHMDNRFVNKLFHLKWYQWFAAGVICSILIFVNGYINMRRGDYAVIYLFWINAVGATLVGWNLARSMEEAAAHFGVIRAAAAWLKHIGRNSIVYVCLNQLVIMECKKYMRELPMPDLALRIVILVVVMCILWILDYIIQNTALRVVTGKK